MTTLTLTDITIQRLPLQTHSQKIYWDESLPGFGVRVGKQTKTFILMRGKTRRLITLGRYPHTSLKSARNAAMLEKSRKYRKEDFSSSKAVQLFLDDAKTRVEPPTHGQYTHYLKFFNLKGSLSDITRTGVRRKLDELEGKPTAQNMAFVTLRNFLNWCAARDYIDRNPIIGMEPPNKLASRDRVLSDEELKAIWKATEPNEGSPGWRKFCRIMRVLICSGQRRQEIAELQPEHVTDFLHFPDTKNGLAHMIPVTPLVREHLDIVPFNFNDWNRCKELLDTKSGVTDWVIHDLRRTFSTNCAKLEVPIHVTEKILNHTTSAVLTNVALIYNRHKYIKEMDDALMAHEEHIRKICEVRKPEPSMPPDERYLQRVTTVLRTS